MPYLSNRRRKFVEASTIHGDEEAHMFVCSTRRRVTITVRGWIGKEPSDAAINLDDANVEKLIKRLSNILTNRRQQVEAKKRKHATP